MDSIHRGAYLRHVNRYQFFVLQVIPVQLIEPAMVNNILNAFFSLLPLFKLPYLLLTSYYKRWITKLLASLSKFIGNFKFDSRIFEYIIIGSSLLKGSIPAIISKMKMPKVHQSLYNKKGLNFKLFY